jgi:hypothetical protein
VYDPDAAATEPGERASERFERRNKDGWYASGFTAAGPARSGFVLTSLWTSTGPVELAEDVVGGGGGAAEGGLGVSAGGGGGAAGGGCRGGAAGGGVAGGGDGGGGGEGEGGHVTVGGGGGGGIVTVTLVVGGPCPSAPCVSANADAKPAATSSSPAAIEAARRPPSRAARMPLL